MNPDHILLTRATCDCDKHDDNRQCPVCDWGLGVCAKCGKAESQLDEPCEPRAMIVVQAQPIVGDEHDLGYFAEVMSGETVLHRTRVWAGEAVNCVRHAEDWAIKNGYRVG
jgi:hypothetical protein